MSLVPGIPLGVVAAIFAPFILAVLGQQVASLWLLRDIRRMSAQIEKRISDPDQHGLGTARNDATLNEIKDLIADLIHYTVWSIKNLTGKDPEPRQPGGN